MSETLLPSDFQHLTPFVAKWDHPGTNERYAERLSSTFDELQAFHQAVDHDFSSISAYLDAKAFADYDEADRRLARLVFAWLPVAEAVEVFKQPRVPDSKMYWDIQVEPDL